MVDADEPMDTIKQAQRVEGTDDSESTSISIDMKESDGKKQDEHDDSSDLNEANISQQVSNIDFLLDIPLEITIELGRTKMMINELLKLGQGSVIELSKFAGETLDIFANQRLIAKGEVVAVNDKYGIRLTEIVTPMERITRSE